MRSLGGCPCVLTLRVFLDNFLCVLLFVISLDALNLHQANLQDKDSIGFSALHGAAAKGNKTIVNQLLQANSQPNAVNNNGWTALHCAAGNGREAVVELLLEAKADPKIVDKNGNTAAKWAEDGGHAALAQRLREAEAKP